MSPKWFLDFFQENPNLRLKTHGFRADVPQNPWKSTHPVKVCDCSANWTLFRRKGAQNCRIRQEASPGSAGRFSRHKATSRSEVRKMYFPHPSAKSRVRESDLTCLQYYHVAGFKHAYFPPPKKNKLLYFV
jgi:hypothetical protein